jgi:hypothetical protein
MSAISEAVPMAPGHVLLWAAVLLAAVAVTVRALDRNLRFSSTGGADGRGLQELRDQPSRDGDGLFWNAFGGLAVIVPALLIPSLASPAVGLVLLFLAACAVPAAVKGSRRLDSVLEARRQADPRSQPGFAAAAERHQALLARWRQYELDPALAIDFPAMGDVRIPQTGTLIRAIQEAERCRNTPGAAYPSAVKQLESALDAAERAAGVAKN